MLFRSLSKYIQHLDETGTLNLVLPELKALQGKNQNPKHHPEGDSFQHTLRALENSRSSDPIANLAIAFHDLGKAVSTSPDVDGHPTYHGHHSESVKIINNIAKRLKFSSKVAEAISFAADNHMKAHNFNELSKKKLYNIVRNPNWEILKAVIYADVQARGDRDDREVLENIKYAEDTANEMDTTAGGHQSVGSMDKRIKEKVNGQIVMQVTGLKSGKIIGDILKEIENWIFDVGIDNVSSQDVINKIRELYNPEQKPL